MKRLLSPSTNATGLTSAVAAIYAAVVMIWNAAHHHAAVDPQVIVAALAAAAALYTRFSVTPVTDPHDGAGRPLMPADSWTTAAGTSMVVQPGARRRPAAKADAGTTTP